MGRFLLDKLRTLTHAAVAKPHFSLQRLADNGQTLSHSIFSPRVSHAPVLAFDPYKTSCVFQLLLSNFIIFLVHFPDHRRATVQPAGGGPRGAIALFLERCRQQTNQEGNRDILPRCCSYLGNPTSSAPCSLTCKRSLAAKFLK